MNKIKLFAFLILLIVIPVLTFTGCSKHDGITSPNNIDFNSPVYALVDYTDLTNSIDDATIDTPMELNSAMYQYSFLNMASFTPENAQRMGLMDGGRWMKQFDWGKHLGINLRLLKLSDEQKAAVKELITKYHDSFKELVSTFAEANKSIVEAANAKRKEIAAEVKAGTLTRAEAAIKIKSLNERTRNAIEENPASKRIKNQMCALRADLLTDIGSKMIGDQVGKWRLIVSLLKSPC